jgi:hypothetical protein
MPSGLVGVERLEQANNVLFDISERETNITDRLILKRHPAQRDRRAGEPFGLRQ